MEDFRGNTARFIRKRISSNGERFWKFSDFEGLPPQAVAQALSRLAREGFLKRIRRGLYYRPKPTILGESQPASSDIALQLLKGPVHPAGLTAANILGFTTQNPRRPELATSAKTSPTLRDASVRTRRSPNRAQLSEHEGGLLEFLRTSARLSDLSPLETTQRLLTQLRKMNLDLLTDAAKAEPPRVRAMLGALGEELGFSPRKLRALKSGLNPLSRFDFGPLRQLSSAEHWQAA